MIEPETYCPKENNWKRLPLLIVLHEWFSENIPNMSNDIGTLMISIAFFVIAWYAIIWLARLLSKLIWPLFVICTAILLFRVLQYHEPEEILAVVTKTMALIADVLVVIVSKVIEYTISFFMS